MAPHQLGIGRAGAFFVESEELLVLGEGDFKFAGEEMLFGNLDLVAFHVAHLFEGRDFDLLQGGEGRVAQGREGRKEDENEE